MTSNQTLGDLAHDDSGGHGPLVVLLPGAGDLRTEYRFLAPPLAAAGYRVVAADLPGHGDSPPAATYGVEESAGALTRLIRSLTTGPAVVIGTSFAPAAAVWAATSEPGLVSGLVAISPHFDDDDSPKGRFQSLLVQTLLRGPWAGALWAGLYRSWYKAAPPGDLDDEIGGLRRMFSDPAQRRAVRETLVAHRRGVTERVAASRVPALVIYGTADDHFDDPEAEAEEVAHRLSGRRLMVSGAGHYPHVERPDLVLPAVLEFLDSVGR